MFFPSKLQKEVMVLIIFCFLSMNKQENQQWIEGNVKMPSGSGAVVPLAKVLGYVNTAIERSNVTAPLTTCFLCQY